MAKQRFSRGVFGKFLTLSTAFLLLSNCLLAAEQSESGPERFKIFPLKHISIERGKNYLAEAGIGTVSRLPGSSALLVTAPAGELTRAQAILNLVDDKERFVIRTVFGALEARNLPSHELISAKLGDISVGSFSNPPGGEGKTKAIVDIHNDGVVIVAPVRILYRIVSAVRQLSTPGNRITQGRSETGGNWKAPELARPVVSDAPFVTKEPVRTQPNPVATMLEQEMPDLPPAVRQYQYEPEPIPNGEDVIQLALPEKLDITEFLGFVGEHLNLNYAYKPDQVKGDVTLRRHGRFRGPIKLKELYPLLESVLQFNGFAMTRRGDLVTIVPVEEVLNIDPDLYPDAKEIEMGDAVITRVFKLDYIDTTNGKNLLDAMKLAVDVRPIAETGTLIVTGYAYRMPRIEQLLDLVDRPGKPRRFRFRQLQYTMSQTLAPKIQTLAEQLGTISITIAATVPEPYRPSQRRSGETSAQYNLRIRQEQAAAARGRAVPSVPSAEPSKPTVYLDYDERTNRILMIGLDEQLDEVEELINTLDVAQQDLRTLELYKIEHVDAEDVKNKLGELGIITISPTSTYPYTSRITGSAQPTTQAAKAQEARIQAIRTQRSDTETEALAEEPQVVVVEPTNSLLVNATDEQHVRIATIIDYLDSEIQEEEIPYKIYPLENQSPEHLREILMPLYEETVLDKEGKIESVIRKQEEQIEIVADPNTFSLIVYASKKNQVWIGDLIEKLDKRRPQVLIDVTLVQVSKTDAFDYDLNIIESFPDLVSTSGLTGAIMPVAEGSNSLISTLLSSGRDRFIDFQSRSGSGTGFYGDRHINALLTAMQQKDYGRILAKPKILVNDNEPGTISTTDTTYVTKQTGTVIQGATAGTIQTAIDYEGYPAGITLEITPHISRGDWLRLDINLDRTDFGTITGEKPPDTSGSNINTTVTVPDGSTIILGGLLKLNQSKGGTKVPILGDIPLVGGLFRSTSNNDIQRNLYVFVKAEIIRPEEEGLMGANLQRISDRNREAFEKHEIEFQNYHDWPGIKPRGMEPLKVLEAQ